MTACRNFQTLDRRALLRVGAAGLGGWSGLAQAANRGSLGKARAKAIILLHQYGGPGQHETFDLKPNAPDGIRGAYKPIASRLPGVPVCELLPNMAKVMDKVTLIRTMQHSMKNHNSAGYYSLTGHAPAVDDQRLRDSLDLFPAYGSVVDRFVPPRKGMPAFVAYPHIMRDGSVTPGQHASFLGKAHNPLFFTQDPNADGFALPELRLPSNLTADRLEQRRALLEQIDRQTELLEQSATAQGIDAAYHKALGMLTTPQIKAAFDISTEPKAVRERYGRTTYGQGCLLARRLVEAGARFVNVYFAASIGGDGGGWDYHGFDGKPMEHHLKNHLLPLTDQTLPTLLLDLDERGLLDETLVVWMGEFGRTPRINKTAGRDHWPQCYTTLLAGGGVKRGFVYGASDKTGAFPTGDVVRPEDLAATLFALMGIDPATEIRDPLNRPFPIATGQVVTGVLA
jgi:hypothetical protein